VDSQTTEYDSTKVKSYLFIFSTSASPLGGFETRAGLSTSGSRKLLFSDTSSV
jgi:hypothetical protein